MRLALALSLLSLLSGCSGLRESHKQKCFEATPYEINCPKEDTTFSFYTGDFFSGDYPEYRATGCGRTYDCTCGEYYEVQCKETVVSNERTTQKIVIDRLALETGCPAENIKIDDKASWSRGTEKAYRMEACGKWYVCTTAAGRTDCKEALSQ